MKGAVLLALAAFAAPLPASAEQQLPKPLFASDAPLGIAIEGPINAIARDRSRQAGHQAVLSLGSERYQVTLTPRGITRRAKDICAFPPLRLEFTTPPPAGSVFFGQRRLKLVTHCRAREDHQQHVLLEYAAYRLLNLLTPLSFRARLLAIDYRESGRGSGLRRAGFLIEDLDDVARRNGLTRTIAGDVIPRARLEPKQAARTALFQYMIGNLDWGMRAGPEGEGCCHNFRLLSRPGSSAAIPIPYDFDFSGLVDAPYATPPDLIPVASVRVRRYRGYCQHNAEALAASREMRDRQGELLQTLTTLPGLHPRTAAKAAAYLAPFFRQIATDEKVQTEILKSCVR